MPPQASQSSSLPPLPPGYTLDSPASSGGIPPLPPGYQLDSQESQTPAAQGGAAPQEPQSTVRPSDARTIPNARIRNLPNPVDPSWGPGRSLYEGAKTGLMVGSLPAAAESTIPGLVRGAIGATLGGSGAQSLAKESGVGEFGQEVAGDVGGLVGGGMASGIPGTRVGKSLTAIARPATSVVEDLPVVGSMVKGVKALGNVRGELADIWAKPTGEPLLTKNPAGPETPTPELLKSRGLATANTPPAQPASQTGEALGQVPQRGSIAQAVKPEAKPITRGSLSQMLQEQLGQGLGASKLDPKMPLRQQLDSMPGKPSADIPEGHTPVQSSALRSYKYDPAAKEFHARYSSGDATTHVFGDVDQEEAQAFDEAPSKGKAMQQIKQGHPLVAKIVNGKRLSVISSK